MIIGVYVFRWTITSGNCASSANDVQVTIYALPTVSNAGPDQNLCNVNNISLAANAAIIGTGNWSLVSGPNVPVITTPSSESSTVTSMISGTYLFRWSITSGVCAPSVDDVQIINYDLPTVSNAGPDQQWCDTDAVTLSGNGPVFGTGLWTMISGPNIPVITNPTDSVTTVTGMIPGIYLFKFMIKYWLSD